MKPFQAIAHVLMLGLSSLNTLDAAAAEANSLVGTYWFPDKSGQVEIYRTPR